MSKFYQFYAFLRKTNAKKPIECIVDDLKYLIRHFNTMNNTERQRYHFRFVWFVMKVHDFIERMDEIENKIAFLSHEIEKKTEVTTEGGFPI